MADHPRSTLGVLLGAGVLGMLLVGGGAPDVEDVEPQVVMTEDDPYAAEELVATETPRATPLAETLAETTGRQTFTGPAPRTKLHLYTCPTARTAFLSRLELEFERKHTAYDLVIHTQADRDCVGHLIMGNCEISIISSKLSNSERRRGLTEHPLAHRITVPVVHASNRLHSMPIETFKALSRGSYANWLQVGGADLEIQTVSKHPPRVDDGGEAAQRMTDKALASAVFLTSPHEILGYIQSHPRAIGLVPLTQIAGVRGIHTLQLSDVAASADSFIRGAWPLGATIRVVLPNRPSEGATTLHQFLRSEDSQKVIERELLPIR